MEDKWVWNRIRAIIPWFALLEVVGFCCIIPLVIRMSVRVTDEWVSEMKDRTDCRLTNIFPDFVLWLFDSNADCSFSESKALPVISDRYISSPKKLVCLGLHNSVCCGINNQYHSSCSPLTDNIWCLWFADLLLYFVESARLVIVLYFWVSMCSTKP